MRKKRQFDYEYFTADICDMYGLSASGLRYFEEKGLLEPEREKKSRYRVFSLTDCSRLFFTRILRQYGFNIDQSVKLVRSGTPEQFAESLAGRGKALEQEIAEKQALLASLKRMEQVYSSIRKKPPIHILTCPVMLRLNLMPGSRASSCANAEDFRLWYAALPFTAASLSIEPESLGLPEPDVSLGFIIESVAAQENGILPSEHTQLLPSRRCLYTVLHCRDTLEDLSRGLAPALSAMRAMKLIPDGAPFTRMLGTVDLGQGMERFDEAWFPVRPTEE